MMKKQSSASWIPSSRGEQYKGYNSSIQPYLSQNKISYNQTSNENPFRNEYTYTTGIRSDNKRPRKANRYEQNTLKESSNHFRTHRYTLKQNINNTDRQYKTLSKSPTYSSSGSSVGSSSYKSSSRTRAPMVRTAAKRTSKMKTPTIRRDKRSTRKQVEIPRRTNTMEYITNSKRSKSTVRNTRTSTLRGKIDQKRTETPAKYRFSSNTTISKDAKEKRKGLSINTSRSITQNETNTPTKKKETLLGKLASKLRSLSPTRKRKSTPNTPTSIQQNRGKILSFGSPIMKTKSTISMTSSNASTESRNYSSTSGSVTTSSSIEERNESMKTSLQSILKHQKRRTNTRGLYNLGNTCFMNSTIQALSHATLFREYFLQSKTESSSRNRLTNAMHSIMKSFYESSNTSAVDASQFKSALSRIAPQYKGTQQHDSAECMRAILDGLHEELNRINKKPPYEEIKDKPNESTIETAERWKAYHLARDSSVIHDMCRTQLASCLSCSVCGHESYTFDHLCDLPIEIPQSKKRRYTYSDEQVSLSDCMKAFFRSETIDGVTCAKCRKCIRATKQLHVFEPPQMLIIQLKRFESFGKRKLSTIVDYPVNETFNLTPYMHPSSPHSSPTYKLVSIVSHFGSLSGGHYTAYAKGGDEQWRCYNDSRVTTASVRQVSGASSSYILIYEAT